MPFPTAAGIRVGTDKIVGFVCPSFPTDLPIYAHLSALHLRKRCPKHIHLGDSLQSLLLTRTGGPQLMRSDNNSTFGPNQRELQIVLPGKDSVTIRFNEKGGIADHDFDPIIRAESKFHQPYWIDLRNLFFIDLTLQNEIFRINSIGPRSLVPPELERILWTRPSIILRKVSPSNEDDASDTNDRVIEFQ